MKPKITMLNVMAGGDFISAMNQFRAWGLEVVDLKNGIFGKSIADLNGREAEDAAKVLQERSLSAYCFSTELFYEENEKGSNISATNISVSWIGS